MLMCLSGNTAEKMRDVCICLKGSTANFHLYLSSLSGYQFCIKIEMQTLVAPTLQQRHPTVSEEEGLGHIGFKGALAKLEVLLLRGDLPFLFHSWFTVK